MLLCCLALYPFRKIFQECGTAVPLNGGVYVALLNSTSKIVATFAAACSLISYSATAVVSAASCTSYARAAYGEFQEMGVTIATLIFFAILVLFGVKDSANVAALIFGFHLITLAVLLVASYVHIIADGGTVLVDNWSYKLPISKSGGVGMDLFLGFSVSLLGLTGFETSANYIEGAL
jgi:amino acid transporter